MSRRSKKLSQVGEQSWLRNLLPKLFWPKSLYPQLCIGPGDDAGAIRITPAHVLVASTDAMVEGVHFERRWFPWECLGEKVLAVNLSDLAAMGDVKPLAALVTASFPGDTPVDYVDKFYKGLESCAQRWKTGLLGGDTVGSKSQWTVSVTILGEGRPEGLIQRSGAKVGDWVVTSGPLGLAAAGLEVLQSGKAQLRWTYALTDAFNKPQPRFDVGSLLGRKKWATSLMDSSDGLEASVRILSDASHVGIALDAIDFPVTPALSRWAALRKRPAWQYALSGGEDYELIFTLPPKHWTAIQRQIPGLSRIGRVVSFKEGCSVLTPNGRLEPLRSYGYSHF